MKIEPLSVTYARALVELALEADKLRPVLEEVRFLDRLLKEERNFRVFLESPNIMGRAKREVLEKAFRGKLDDVVLNFLALVVHKGRQFLLPEMFAEVEVLYDQAVGRIHVEATTARPLAQRGQKSLSEALEKKLKRAVVLVNRVRPEILGGLVIRYGDMVVDDSVIRDLLDVSGRILSHKLGSELVHENQS